MCVSPVKLIDGRFVSCHKCWQCGENRIRDWCGRCIAESETAVGCHAVTFTYGRSPDDNPNHERAAVLTYSDFQKYLKRLRAGGYPARYVVAGECGSMKGRTHWHAIMFWQRRIPPHQLRVERCMNHTFWTGHDFLGHTYWDEINYKSVHYVCKYIQEDVRDKRAQQSEFHMSKRPPIGADYFKLHALKYVKDGLSPQSPFYTFPNVCDRNGKQIKFMLSGATLDVFCKAFVDAWAKERGGHYPTSEMIEEYEDRAVRNAKNELGARKHIFPLVHPLNVDREKYTVVEWDKETGEGKWLERERDVTLEEQWRKQYPKIPFPGRFERFDRR